MANLYVTPVSIMTHTYIKKDRKLPRNSMHIIHRVLSNMYFVVIMLVY